MRSALIALLLCFTALVSAQNAGPSSIPAFVAPENLAITGVRMPGCPVAMRAERQAWGQREWIVSLEDSRQALPINKGQPHTAGVHVIVDAMTARKITQAEVTVYYMALGIHALQVGDDRAAPGRPSYLKKTFVLSSADATPSLRLDRSLMVGPASTVTRVRLMSVSYADGSAWHASRGSGCSVEPGLMIAVAAR